YRRLDRRSGLGPAVLGLSAFHRGVPARARAGAARRADHEGAGLRRALHQPGLVHLRCAEDAGRPARPTPGGPPPSPRHAGAAPAAIEAQSRAGFTRLRQIGRAELRDIRQKSYELANAYKAELLANG